MLSQKMPYHPLLNWITIFPTYLIQNAGVFYVLVIVNSVQYTLGYKYHLLDLGE